MAKIILFHSALGLNNSVKSFARTLSERGYEVETPDLFDGAVFENLAEGVTRRDEIGIAALSERAAGALTPKDQDIILMGFSMGAASAQMLGATHPGAIGCVLMHAALPIQVFGLSNWPKNVPVQFHASKHDPWVENQIIESLKTEIAEFDVNWYEGSAHLFADETGGEYNRAHAKEMTEKVLRFVEGL